MKLFRFTLTFLVSFFTFLSLSYAGMGEGKLENISVHSNGDVIFTTTQHHQAPQCNTENQWVILHDDPQADALYGSVLVAALQNANVTVEGAGRCAQASQQEIVTQFGFEKNAENWLNARASLTQAFDAKIAQPTELNGLMEELLQVFGGEKVRTYEHISTQDVNCLLEVVETQLVSSGLFNDIVVPRTTSGTVTFTMGSGILKKYFEISYAHNNAKQELRIEIVKTGIAEAIVWKIIDDGMGACVEAKK